MSHRVVVRSLLLGLGGLALAVGVRAQVAPQEPGRELPEAARREAAQRRDAYRFSRSLFALRERAQAAASLEAGQGRAKRALPDAVEGNASIPVFLVRFANTDSVAYPPSELEQALFSTDPDSATLRAYYLEQSGGRLSVGGQVFGWHELPADDSYYEGSTNGLVPGDSRTGELIANTLAAYDDTLDFGQFDNDGPDGIPNSGDDDGYVDFVAFVHSETGGECGGSSQNLWSHRWRYSVWPASGGLPYATDDPSAGGGQILVDDYVLQPGLRCSGDGRIEIGVFCHEFGHAFGLPDLYDTNGGGEQGIGDWGLMSSGNWNSPDSPAHMSAWTKQELGWVQTIPIEWAQTTLSLPPVEISHQVYEVVVDEERWKRSTDCVISGSASMAVGGDLSASQVRGWAAPRGYGNGWVETVAHDFHSDGTGPVGLDYDYQVDSEGGFDFAFVIVEVGGTETTLAVYDGQAAGHAHHDLAGVLGSGPVDFRVKFRFRSDEAYSNEDGNFVCACSPFVVDGVQVQGGGLDEVSDFESSRQGWYGPDSAVDNPVSESWLLENRQPLGFDEHLHGRGVVLYHVDRQVLDSLNGNSGGATGASTRGLVVEEADGNFDLLNPVASNRGDAGDPWPGIAKASAFDSTTVPAAMTDDGKPSNFVFEALGVSGDDVQVRFAGGAWPPEVSAVTPDSVATGTGLLHLDAVGAARVRPGAILRLVAAGGVECVSSATQWEDYDRVGFDVDLSRMGSGDYDVVLQNPDGQNAVVAGGLRLRSQATANPPVSTLPHALRLAQNFPNPFNPRTTILFDLPTDGWVRLAIYDLQGRRVRTLLDGPMPAGTASVVFDGKDARGREVASGVYLYRLERDGEQRQKKMLLVR